MIGDVRGVIQVNISLFIFALLVAMGIFDRRMILIFGAKYFLLVAYEYIFHLWYDEDQGRSNVECEQMSHLFG